MARGLQASVLLLVLGCAGMDRPGAPMSAVPQRVTRGDLGTVFKTVDEAAVAGCAYLWQNEPRATEQEYCGAIYRDAEGIKAGLPETSELATRCRRPRDPSGATPEGGYHNHRQTSTFSADDRRLATELARYLCTPSRMVLRMTAEGSVIVK